MIPEMSEARLLPRLPLPQRLPPRLQQCLPPRLQQCLPLPQPLPPLLPTPKDPQG